MSDIGFFLKIRRKQARLSQGALAAKLSEILGTEFQYTAIAKIEKGKRGISFQEAAALSIVLDFSLNDLAELTLPNPGLLDSDIVDFAESYANSSIPYEVV